MFSNITLTVLVYNYKIILFVSKYVPIKFLFYFYPKKHINPKEMVMNQASNINFFYKYIICQ